MIFRELLISGCLPYQELHGHLDARAEKLLRLDDRRLVEVGGERVDREPGAVPGEGAAPGRTGAVQVWRKMVLDLCRVEENLANDTEFK